VTHARLSASNTFQMPGHGGQLRQQVVMVVRKQRVAPLVGRPTVDFVHRQSCFDSTGIMVEEPAHARLSQQGEEVQSVGCGKVKAKSMASKQGQSIRQRILRSRHAAIHA